jgi:hypothetical protein
MYSQEQAMSESQPSSGGVRVGTRKISSQERAVLVGDMIVINGSGVNRAVLKQRFAEGGYQARETEHFLLFLREQTPGTVLVHWFTPEELNADIKHYLAYELKPFGLLKKSRDFGDILSGIVSSFFREDARFA